MSGTVMRRLIHAAGFALAMVAAHVAAIVLYGFLGGAPAGHRADAALVFGNRVYRDGTPSRRLKQRLEGALLLYRTGRVRYVIVSGGVDADGVDEARGMAAWLEARGVLQGHVISDPLGNTSLLTVLNYQRTRRVHGIRSVTMVSQYYHLARVRLIAYRLGIPQVTVQRAPYHFEPRQIYSVLREIPALYYYLFRELPRRERVLAT